MIAESVGAIVGGGITGLAGTAITNALEIRKQEKADQHQREMTKLELDIMKEESQRSSSTVTLEEPTEDPNDLSTLSAKFIKSDNPVINFLRASVRPVITYVLAAFCLYSIWKLSNVINYADPANEQILLMIYQECMTVLLYVFSTVVLWWFGTRLKMRKQ